VGGLIALIIVYFALFKQLKSTDGKSPFKQTLKSLLVYGLPLTVSTIVVGVMPQIIASTMAIYAGTEVMGNYYVSTYFVSLLTFITFPVSTVLFPIFSKINPESEPALIKRVFSFSVKYMSILLVPATMLLITLSGPAINFLFPEAGFLRSLWSINPDPKYPFAPFFLILSCLVALLVLIGNLTLGSLQTGLRETRQIMKQSLVSLLIGLPVAIALISFLFSIGGPSYAIMGGILGSIIATAINLTWGAYWGWKKYSVKADFKISSRILVSSLLAAGLAYLFVSILNLPNLFLLIGGFILFLFTYVTVAPLIGAINQNDLDNLFTMTSSLGPASKILKPLLMYMQKISQKTRLYNAD
jgi:O-antigen/teichoic acid export membrane protein